MIASVAELLAARRVAVIGASDDPEKIAGKPFAFLRRDRFDGQVWAVNPTRDTVQGVRAYPSVADIGEPVDLAIITVPARHVLGAVRDCVAAKVRGAVVFAGGMAETGDEGRRLETEVAAVAREGGLRLIGPNCIGLMNMQTGLMATFSNTVEDLAPAAVREGIAVVSQSGALGNYILTRALDSGIPVAQWVATGNEADVEFSEALEAMLEAPGVRGVLGYLEGARNGPRLRSVLEKARVKGMPIALIKVGRTEVGATAIRSHTDALAGDDTLYDAMLKDAGVARVDTVDELVELGRALGSGTRVTGSDVLFSSVSGGVGVIMAEAATDLGLTLPPLSAAAGAALKAKLPFMSPANPLDVTGQVVQDFDLLKAALEIGIEDTGAGCVISFIGRIARRPKVLAQYMDALDALDVQFPKSRVLTVGMLDADSAALFAQRGRLAFADPSRAVWAASVLARQSAAFARAAAPAMDVRAMQVAAPDRAPTEKDGYDLLARIGIDAPRNMQVHSAEEAARAATALSAPLAMKVLSPDIAHKSEMGGVRLGLATPDAAAAYNDILQSVGRAAPQAQIDGALLVEMASDFEELVIGARIDDQLGPSIMVGLGGIFVEVLGDVAVRLAPVTPKTALQMLAELKGAAILTGARGRPPRDLDAAAAAISRLSCFAAANADWLSSIEINPLAVKAKGGGVRALDCAIAVKPAKEETP